jgi:hypothetical protein
VSLLSAADALVISNNSLHRAGRGAQVIECLSIKHEAMSANSSSIKKKNEDRGFMRVVEGVNSSVIYLIHCKKLCKCHTVPPPSTIKEKN